MPQLMALQNQNKNLVKQLFCRAESTSKKHWLFRVDQLGDEQNTSQIKLFHFETISQNLTLLGRQRLYKGFEISEGMAMLRAVRSCK